jgi:cyclopropane-fatty-acyl-phospholipid synthase
MDAVELAKSVFDDGTRNFAVELWDGSLLPAEQDAVPGSRVALCRPETLSFFLPPTSERRLAEAYIGGLLELRGDTCGLLEAAAHWRGPRRGLGLRTLLAGWHARRAKPPPGVAPLPRRHGSLHHERRDREAIRQHYDRAAELCALFLDESRTYSCAYFPTGNESLERAQEAKHELICRKLELEPRQRLLDIGCGWGAFMMHARSRYRVRVLGTTLSEEQFKYVERTISSLPPGPEIAVRLLDYRELDCESCFDKVSSVGMMEHVGAASLQHYFASVYGALRPGGLFLNHAIAALPGHHSTLPWMSFPRRRLHR